MINNEKILNNYYNIGGFNKPSRIGYVMNLIRQLRPLTEDEWKIWYLENIHNKEYLHNIAIEMQKTIPSNFKIDVADCEKYIYDVMFRRSFLGYNKEKHALSILKKVISENIQEAPKDWDTKYFIDFFIKTNDKIIGIQLKPETFYLGNYQSVVKIKEKMDSFCKEKNAKAFVIKYKQNSNANNINFTNKEVITDIKKLL